MGANNQPGSKPDQYSQISSNSTSNYGSQNTYNQQSSFQKIKQNEEFMKKIQSKYPQVTTKEWQLFLQSSNNSNTLSELMNMSESDFKAALLKHITTQQTKYTSLCEKMRKARMEQIAYQASQKASQQPSEISGESMNQLLQQADILSKIDKMRDFFLLKENNPLQLSVHISSLIIAIKNILDFPDEEHKHYFTIAKNITAFAQNLSRLCVLAGFVESHADEECIILYYEQKDTGLLRVILSYLRQNYQSYVKTMKQLEDEVRQAGREIKQNNNKEKNTVAQMNQTNEIVEQQMQLSTNNVPFSQQGSATTSKSDPRQQVGVIQENVDVQIDGSAICIKMKEGAETRAVRERVLAQLEAQKRRNDKAYQQQYQNSQSSNISENNQTRRVQNNQDPKRFSERMTMEMETLKGSESQRIEEIFVQAINEFRISRHLNPLRVDNQIGIACSMHSSYLAHAQTLNHQDIENRSREINIISPYSTLYELVASSIPADSQVIFQIKYICDDLSLHTNLKKQRVVEKWGNSEMHRSGLLLSELTHVCVSVTLQKEQ